MSQENRDPAADVLDPSYIEGVNDEPIEKLRSLRDEARDVETGLSFERRLCQARIDILAAELEDRAGDGSSGVMERLPEILAHQTRQDSGPLPDRAPDLSTPRDVDVQRGRIDEIAGEKTLARLGQMSEDEIKEILKTLADHEREVSDRRKQVQEVVDTIQAEIVRRYVSGEADPSAALG